MYIRQHLETPLYLSPEDPPFLDDANMHQALLSSKSAGAAENASRQPINADIFRVNFTFLFMISLIASGISIVSFAGYLKSSLVH